MPMDTISLFTTRVRQMIIRCKELEEENTRLRQEIERKDALAGQMEERLRSAHHDYDNLMEAKILEVSDGDLENTKRRLSRLIREVNKCITLISDK